MPSMLNKKGCLNIFKQPHINEFLLIREREIFFSYPADWAYPIIRNVFESRSGLYSTVGIAFGRIIYVSANLAFVLFHDRSVEW